MAAFVGKFRHLVRKGACVLRNGGIRPILPLIDMNETREMTEEELVASAKAKDGAAWTELYNRHFEQLYRYAYAKLGSREQAEDIAAQVFLNALKSIDQFDYRGKPLLAWLYRIASNLVLQEVRSRRRGESWQVNGISQSIVAEDPS